MNEYLLVISNIFDEITLSLSKAVLKYENYVLMVDSNIGVSVFVTESNKLEKSWIPFDVTNFIRETKCSTKYK